MKLFSIDTEKHRNEILIVLFTCVVVSALTLMLTDMNSVVPDETEYLHVGKSILEGSYPVDFSHRLPLMPSIMALLLLSGVEVAGIRLIVSLLFMNLFVVSSYLLPRVLYGRRAAEVALLFALTFPLFWRWGLSVLVDVPLACMSILFLTFFFLATKGDKRYFILSAVMLSLGLLLKPVILLFAVPAFLYLLLTKRWRLMVSKEFLLATVFVPAFFILVYLMFNTFTSAAINPFYNITFLASEWNISELLKMLMMPSFVLSIVGLAAIVLRRTKKTLTRLHDEDLFLLLGGLFYFFFYIYTGHLRLRYFLPLVPLMGIAAYLGWHKFRSIIKPKRIVDAIFVVIIIITAMNALYLVNLEESTLWGTEELSSYMNSIEGDATFSMRYLPKYFMVSTDKEIVPILQYVRVGDESIERYEFFGITANVSHPKQAEYAEMTKMWSELDKYYVYDYEWFRERGVDYVVHAVYEDYEYAGETVYFFPTFGPFEITFIKRPYNNGRVPPNYEFKSETFIELEEDSRFELVKEIYKGDQRVFLIYKL